MCFDKYSPLPMYFPFEDHLSHFPPLCKYTGVRAVCIVHVYCNTAVQIFLATQAIKFLCLVHACLCDHDVQHSSSTHI